MTIKNDSAVLTINNIRWTVLAVSDDDERLNSNEGVCLGMTYYVQNTICLNRDLCRTVFIQTLIHELVHVFAFCYGIHFEVGAKTEEIVCDFVGAFHDKIDSAVKKVIACFDGGDVA